MVKTFGLTHIALAVKDPERSAAFYGAIFGAQVTYREAGFVQIQTPDSKDVIVFKQDETAAGRGGGVEHFGFRLTRPEDIEVALQEVERAGGKILQHGEFAPGEPYLFFTDPDGYEVEIWYELSEFDTGS